MHKLPRNIAHLRVHRNYIEVSAKGQAFIEARPYALRESDTGYLLIPAMPGETAWTPRRYGRFMRFESRQWVDTLGAGMTYDIVGYGPCIAIEAKQAHAEA